MRFYIASGLQNFENARYAAEKLRGQGFIQTYDWTHNEKTDSMEEIVRRGRLEINGVRDADFVVVLLPGGKGTHTEFGIALGLGKRIYLYSEEELNDPLNTTTFYHVEEVNPYVGDIDGLIEKVIGEERGGIQP